MKGYGIERRLADEPEVVGKVVQLPDSSGLVVVKLGGISIILDEEYWQTGELGIRNRRAAERDLEVRVLLSRDSRTNLMNSGTALLLGRRGVEGIEGGSGVAYFEVLEGPIGKV